MYISFHSLLDEPKSCVLSSSGTMSESTSPPNTILSVSASPRVNVPPLKVVVPVTVRLPPIPKLPDMSALPFISMVVAAICISVSATKSNCPSVDELMYIAVSLNCNFSVEATSMSSLNSK